MSAQAWSNGVNGYNSFGTHDWILREAIDALGDDASWICLGRALRATDDPDSMDGIDHASGTWWHVWDEWGSYGGGPEAIRVWFNRTEHKLEQGTTAARAGRWGSWPISRGTWRSRCTPTVDLDRGQRPFGL